jgi:hypothetical protein
MTFSVLLIKKLQVLLYAIFYDEMFLRKMIKFPLSYTDPQTEIFNLRNKFSIDPPQQNASKFKY